MQEQIYSVMDLLEQIPQGGVGCLGSTAAEIAEAEANGACVDGDATYHVVQKAWLMLREIANRTYENHGN